MTLALQPSMTWHPPRIADAYDWRNMRTFRRYWALERRVLAAKATSKELVRYRKMRKSREAFLAEFSYEPLNNMASDTSARVRVFADTVFPFPKRKAKR